MAVKPVKFNPLQFGREAVDELKKVHTPTWEETWRASIGVFFMLAIFGVFLGLTDYIVGTSVRRLLGAE
jgi:preprotein translocase SecE subunit